MSAGAVPFTITAMLGRESCRATRLLAASAMVLADRWARAGCLDVRVTGPDGIAHERDAFRQTLRFRRRSAPG